MTYKYTCIKNKQRDHEFAPEFLLFHAKASEIDQWAAIEKHTAVTRDGPQRMAKPAKVSDVKRFLERDPRNTISTALLVSLNFEVGSLVSISAEHPDIYSLEFTLQSADAGAPEKPGMIVDGQHRLLGALKFQPDLLLNVVAMINPSDEETAFQFLVVNNKASRVSNNHIRALALKYEEHALSKRLQEVRMSISQHLNFVGFVDREDGSPFFGIIDWPDNHVEGKKPDGFVAPSAIESSIAYIKQKRIQELEDDAMLLGFFLAIWGEVMRKWEALFNRDSHLLEKVSVICLTQFLVDQIAFEYDSGTLDITDFDAIKNRVDKVTDGISRKFWEMKWAKTSLDTTVGRTMFMESLTQMRRNVNADRVWYQDVPLVDLQGEL